MALRALKLSANDPELFYNFGLLYLQENDPERAMVQLKKALEVRPDYLPARVELARMALKEENYLSAEEHLSKILQQNGKSAQAHLALGLAYKGMGQYDKALKEYEVAEKLDPDLAAAYLNRAIVLHRHKDAPERALELYQKYLDVAGPGAISGESPVLSLKSEAEQLIAAKAEAKRMEEEAKKAAASKPAETGKVQPASGDQPSAAVPAAQVSPQVSKKGSKREVGSDLLTEPKD